MADYSAPLSVKASDKFYRHFQQVVNDLQNQIQKIEETKHPGSEHADAIDHCLSGIARLSNEVNEASSYLAAYDQRTYSEALSTLKNKLQQARSSAVPKPRFSFKTKPLFTANKNESAISIGDVAELANRKLSRIPGHQSDISNDSSFVNSPAVLASPPNETTDSECDGLTNTHNTTSKGERPGQTSSSQSNTTTITNQENVRIILPSYTTHSNASGTVSRLRHSVIDMSAPAHAGNALAGLTLKDITSSLIICGRVDGAAHLTSIHNSVIIVSSRQFRMHASSGCDVYLLTSSRPIIEDCSDIRFAPLPAIYMSEEDKQAQNQWSSVDDFKWLQQEPSPNWRILDSAQIIPDETWRDTVSGVPEIGVDDILASVGISK